MVQRLLKLQDDGAGSDKIMGYKIRKLAAYGIKFACKHIGGVLYDNL